MSLLSQTTVGAKNLPQMYVLMGLAGVGKTTFAAQFPKPLVLDLEDGSKRVRTTRLGKDVLGSYEKLNQALDELLEGTHAFKTIVVDSFTALEKLLKEKVCADAKVTTIEEIPYGGGVPLLQAAYEVVISKLKRLQDMGNDIIVISHTAIKPFTDPTLNATYDRYNLQAHKSLAPELLAIADNVFFCTYQVDTAINSKTKKTEASSDGSRVMFTEFRASHVGKNRLGLPYELPMDYAALKKAIEDHKPKSVEELKAEIELNLKLAAEKVEPKRLEAASKAAHDAGDDEATLERILSKLKEIVNA